VVASIVSDLEVIRKRLQKLTYIEASPFSPMYAGTKAGVTNFMRSIAKAYYVNDRIRANTINPGTVRTNLLDQEAWNHFPDSYFTPVSKIVEVVLMLVDGGEMVDSKSVKVEAGKDWGRAVEVNGTNHYFREQVDYCDEAMAAVMRATDVSEVGNGKFYDTN
jgi:NAD(P)-dependent dehydrogenase (short-subunit alcohol dehydrogenase family)